MNIKSTKKEKIISAIVIILFLVFPFIWYFNISDNLVFSTTNRFLSNFKGDELKPGDFFSIKYLGFYLIYTFPEYFGILYPIFILSTILFITQISKFQDYLILLLIIVPLLIFTTLPMKHLDHIYPVIFIIILVSVKQIILLTESISKLILPIITFFLIIYLSFNVLNFFSQPSLNQKLVDYFPDNSSRVFIINGNNFETLDEIEYFSFLRNQNLEIYYEYKYRGINLTITAYDHCILNNLTKFSYKEEKVIYDTVLFRHINKTNKECRTLSKEDLIFDPSINYVVLIEESLNTNNSFFYLKYSPFNNTMFQKKYNLETILKSNKDTKQYIIFKKVN